MSFHVEPSMSFHVNMEGCIGVLCTVPMPLRNWPVQTYADGAQACLAFAISVQVGRCDKSPLVVKMCL